MKQLIYGAQLFSAPGYGYGLHLLFFFGMALEGQKITITYSPSVVALTAVLDDISLSTFLTWEMSIGKYTRDSA